MALLEASGAAAAGSGAALPARPPVATPQRFGTKARASRRAPRLALARWRPASVKIRAANSGDPFAEDPLDPLHIGKVP
jgi:hypothetical protein